MTLETLEKGKVQYTAKTHTTGGRAGASRSDDGRLDIRLSIPGTSGNGTNPEQLFAAGWSAGFEGAVGLAARKMKMSLPAGKVDLCNPPSSPKWQLARIGERTRSGPG